MDEWMNGVSKVKLRGDGKVEKFRVSQCFWRRR